VSLSHCFFHFRQKVRHRFWFYSFDIFRFFVFLILFSFFLYFCVLPLTFSGSFPEQKVVSAFLTAVDREFRQ